MRLLLLVLLAGCAHERRGPAADSVSLEVPVFTETGGRGALAEVLTFWDEPTEPRDLVFRREGEKTAILLAAQDRGMQTRSFQATVNDVREELKLGHPVLAYVALGAILPQERFVVIAGFDDARGAFLIHDGGERRFVPYGTFMSRWEKTGRWAILVLPAGERATL
jgi:hypothetical protein